MFGEEEGVCQSCNKCGVRKGGKRKVISAVRRWGKCIREYGI